MSSGFVSAGTNEEPVERDDEWLKAQQELEEERRRKAEIGKQTDGKSLYEVLQQNKMAKQEAFEEKIRLKNQFRALDEDEVDFLDSVLESTRAQEEAVRKDTADQLEVFRKQREEAEKVLLGTTSSEIMPNEEEEWSIPARKRRRDKGRELLVPGKKRKGSNLDTESAASGRVEGSEKEEARKSSRGDIATPETDRQASAAPKVVVGSESAGNVEKGPAGATQTTQKSSTAQQAKTQDSAKTTSGSLSLVGYGSDSDSD